MNTTLRKLRAKYNQTNKQKQKEKECIDNMAFTEGRVTLKAPKGRIPYQEDSGGNRQKKKKNSLNSILGFTSVTY